MSSLQSSVKTTKSGPLIVLSGAADMSTMTRLTWVINSQLSAITRHLRFDVSELHVADSTAIWLLLLVARTLRGRGGSMMLLQPQPVVAMALTLADADQLITICGTTPA